jgi:hypothetical protein
MDEKCSYCKDPETPVTLYRKTSRQHRVQAVMDASPEHAQVTFAVVRLSGSSTKMARLQSASGFAINYCPICGRKLRREDTIIK